MLRYSAFRPLVSARQHVFGSSSPLSRNTMKVGLLPLLGRPARPQTVYSSSISSSSMGSRLSRPPYVQAALFNTTGIPRMEGKVTGESLRHEQAHNRNQKLQHNPNVSSTSSIRPVFESAPSSVPNATDDPDMMRGIRSDLRTIRETFALGEVPKEVFWIGMGGLAPYVVTSFTTLYLAWDLNYANANNGVAYLVSKETADHLLHILEPTQIGLGAIILSFLGAVHWGLEMAKYGGSYPYLRYGIGIIAPALAWPSIMFPLHYALLTQFAGLTGMCYFDAQATARGWAPKWYNTYRFILTGVVGTCILMTLIGRSQIGDTVLPSENARRHFQEIRISQREELQKRADKRAEQRAEEKKAKEQAERQSAEEKKAEGEEGTRKDEGESKDEAEDRGSNGKNTKRDQGASTSEEAASKKR